MHFYFCDGTVRKEKKRSDIARRGNIIGQGGSSYPYGEETLLDKAGLGFFSPFCKCNILRRARRAYYRDRE